MRPIPLLTAILAGLEIATAHPGMGQKLKSLKYNPRALTGPSLEAIGDLITLADEDLSPTGGVIKRLLTSFQEFTQDDTTFYEPSPAPQLGTQACKADTCCVWKHIADELHNAYVQSDLQCNNLARAAVRLGFHDAGTWNRARGNNGGGADGSIILAGECEARTGDNGGLEPICAQIRTWYDKYKIYGISMADLIQVSAYVAVVTCPMGPRIRLFVGRKDNSAPSPENLMPFTHQTPDELFSLFEDKTIHGEDLVALLGAHTVAKQQFEDPSQAGAALDSTPGVWDITFYNETLWTGFPKNIFRFKSDVAIGNHQSSAGGLWRQFANRNGGADGWPPSFSKAFIRLSLLGVYNLNDLTECTSILPRRIEFSEIFPNGRPDPF